MSMTLRRDTKRGKGEKERDNEREEKRGEKRRGGIRGPVIFILLPCDGEVGATDEHDVGGLSRPASTWPSGQVTMCCGYK